MKNLTKTAGTKTLRVIGLALRWHPWACATFAATVVLVVLAGAAQTALLAVLVAGGLATWSQVHGPTFSRLVGSRARSGWRHEWVYRRRWRSLMFLSGLACRFDGAEVIPRLGRVRCGWATDHVQVRLSDAQESIDWEARSGALAETFGAIDCRARGLRPHWIELDITFHRNIPLVEALPVPDEPDLEGLPIGRQGDGLPWLLRLRGTHVAVVGATDSGKGSVLWSIIRALVGWSHRGLAQLWVADPKGGVELGHGDIDPTTRQPTCPLFHRFARTPDTIAAMLEAGVEMMLARAARLAGVARQHTPSADEPLVVIIIDELAHLATYGTDDVRRRTAQALGLLLSEGRALGFHVVAAIQNPGQLKVDLRRAFPTRICLRTSDDDQVEMILGREAWARGARCEAIPASTPGCAWVVLDRRDPTWVRASWISDQDIVDMAATYPAYVPPVDSDSSEMADGVELAVAATRGAA